VKPSPHPLFQAFATTRPHPRDVFLPSEASPPTTAAVSGQNRRGVTTSPPREDITIRAGRPTATFIARSSSPDVHCLPCPLTVACLP
jgi:hypothetical protein